MSTGTLPRETVEFVGPVTVTADGEPVTTFEVAMLAARSRPAEADWPEPDPVDGTPGVLVGGWHRPRARARLVKLWVRYEVLPERIVLADGGTILIT